MYDSTVPDQVHWVYVLSQLQKVYKDDMGGIEAQEDMARMREHALAEVRHTYTPLSLSGTVCLCVYRWISIITE